MPVTRVTPKLPASGQPSLTRIADLMALGVTTIRNNWPDGEDQAQPGAAAGRGAAVGIGLAFLDLPLAAETITLRDVGRFRGIVELAPGPLLAHCRGGRRALTLHVLGEGPVLGDDFGGRMRLEDLQADGADFRFDLTGAIAWLDQHPPDRLADAEAMPAAEMTS